MLKPLLISTLVITATGFASPWVMGIVSEKQFEKEISSISLESNPNLKIHDYQFERGYMNSKASAIFTFSAPEQGIPDISITLESNLQHTPLTFNDNASLFLEIYSQDKIVLSDAPEEVKAFVDTYLNGVLLTGHSYVNMLGDYTSVLTSPQIHFSDDETSLAVNIDAMHINTTGDLNNKDSITSLNLPMVSINGVDFNVLLEGITAEANLHNHSGIDLGSTNLNIKKINIASEKGNAELGNMAFSGNSSIVNDKVNTTVAYSIESIHSPLPLASASYNVEVNSFSLEAAALMEDLQAHIENIQPAELAMDDFFNQLLTTTLQPGLQLNQELNINAFGGDWLADLDIEFVGLDGVELLELTDPKIAIKTISADMLIKANSQAIKKTPAAPMLQSLIEQGFIKQEDSNFVSRLNISQGKLTVNEKDIPLEPIIEVAMIKIASSQQEQSVN